MLLINSLVFFLFVIVNLVYSVIGKLAPENLIKFFLNFRIICIVFVFIISLSCVNFIVVDIWLSRYVSLFPVTTINRFRLRAKLSDLFE